MCIRDSPLVVPQTCLRFKDLENVGVTGRHFSSFCMIGQHSVPNNQGYWKDECVDLDYRLLTDQFGIKKEDIKLTDSPDNPKIGSVVVEVFPYHLEIARVRTIRNTSFISGVIKIIELKIDVNGNYID